MSEAELLPTNLSIDSELVHGINDAQQGVNGLGFLANHSLVDIEIDVVMVEIGLHLLAIQIEDVHVHDSQATTPSFVAVGKISLAGVKDAVDEGKVIFNLLVALDVKAIGGSGNSSG